MKFKLTVLAAVLLAAMSAVCADHAENEILVKYKPGIKAQLSVKTVSAKAVGNFAKTRTERIKLPENISAEEAIEMLKDKPGIEYVGFNHKLKVAAVYPNDPIFQEGYYNEDYDLEDILGEYWDILGPLYGDYGGVGGMLSGSAYQWGLWDRENGFDMKLPQAWEITTGSSDVIVAVLDTGIDYLHPDMADKVWWNPNEEDDGIDNDGNGFVDDVVGWNFVTDEPDPWDDHETYGMPVQHGTVSSSIIGAATNNNLGIAGVAWNCPIMPVKVMAGDGTGLESDCADGIIYAVDMGVKIINMSLATDEDVPVLRDAVAYAVAHDVLCVCATGNEDSGAPHYPAAYPGALAVGAYNKSGERCTSADWGQGGSNYGDYIDVVAPGNTILGCSSMVKDQDYFYFDGTSAASPMACGVAALLKSVHPDWSAQRIAEQIKRTADDCGSPGYDIYTGYGRVNAYRALTETIEDISDLSEAKRAELGSYVNLTDMVLTVSSGEIENMLFAQTKNRVSGVMLYFPSGVPSGYTAGDVVKISGSSDLYDGNFCIKNPTMEKTGETFDIKPFGMVNVRVGGGAFGNQPGVVDSYSYPRTFSEGLTNIGCVVRTAGKITAVGADWFYISDGTPLDDGAGYDGIYVHTPEGVVRPNINKKVIITGVSTGSVVGNTSVVRRVLIPRRQSDITVLK